jgi:predicted Zn finger-like uncharacterized protein
MIVVCPSCSARFQYDEARFQGAPSKRFKCPKCSATFEVMNPTAHTYTPPDKEPISRQAPSTLEAPTPVPAPVPTPSPAPAPDPGQSVRDTTARKDRDTMLAAAGLKESGGPIPAGWRFSLAFLTGPQASTVKVLDKAVTVIGREEGDVITRDPETSRVHACIEIHPDGSVWLTDQGSTNGTFLDNVQIYGTVQLTDRQEFTCGKSTFMILIRQENTHSLE